MKKERHKCHLHFLKEDHSHPHAKNVRARQEIALLLARAFVASDQTFDCSCILQKNPNDLPDHLKQAYKDEFGIDENWLLTRIGIHVDVDRDNNEENAVMKSTITEQVKGGLILSKAILQKGTRYASHMTLTHPFDMKRVNNFPGILVAAKTLQEKTDLFQGKKLKTLDCDLWFTMAWASGFEHIHVSRFGRFGLIPVDTKIYVNVLYPENVFYKKLRSHGVTTNSGNYFFPPNHAMSARIHGMAIGDVWLEITYRGPDVDLGIETLAWNPPTAAANFDELFLTDPPARSLT